MTEELYTTLKTIKTRKVYGDGTTFTYCGKDISLDVLLAMTEGYAEHDPEAPYVPVSLTNTGRKAYGDYTPSPELQAATEALQ